MDTNVSTPTFDRTTEDLGNIVELGHVNVRVPDQSKAIAYYLMGLGLTRDPYLMAGLDNMWVNVGRGQFHLPTRGMDVVRGTVGLVMPNLDHLLTRLDGAKKYLEGTKFSFREAGDTVETTCPWGNRIRVHAPDPAKFGPMRVGMPYVEFDIPAGTDLSAIAKFYVEILGAIAGVDKDERGPFAWARYFRREQGHLPRDHRADPGIRRPPHPDHPGGLLRPAQKTAGARPDQRESDQHQYRFLDIVDVDTNKPLFRIEHETRSMRHPMFGRTFINRNPDMTNRNFIPGYEVGLWALPE